METAFYGLFTVSMCTIAVASLSKCKEIPPYKPANSSDLSSPHEEHEDEIEGLNTWDCKPDKEYS